MWLGTSSAARPRNIKRTRSAVTQSAEGGEIVQTVLMDTRPRIGRGVHGVAAAIITLFRLVEDVESEGPRKIIQRFVAEKAKEVSLPVILQAIDRVATDMLPVDLGPTLLNDLARKALVQTVAGVLQGRQTNVSIPTGRMEKNLEASVIEFGTTGLIAALLGNYLASLTLFYAGRLMSENLGTTERLATLAGKEALEKDVRTQSRRIGRRLANNILNQLETKTLKDGDIERVASLLSHLLPDIVSEFLEESR